jgi:hypothetical protein
MFEIFITHDWRESDNYNLIVKSIDQLFEFGWRNYSNFWHDPRLRITNQGDASILESIMHDQILPARLVIELPHLSKDSRGKKWLEYSLALARELEIPVLRINIDDYTEKDKGVNYAECIDEKKLKKLRKSILEIYAG